MAKPHIEFTGVNLASGWETPAGYPEGIKQKVLASDLNEAAKTGSRTRLLRFAPGAFSSVPFVHEYWEEVYLLAGALKVGSDARGHGGKTFEGATYACRPPGVPHGPFSAPGGCLIFEFHYYAAKPQ